MRPIRNYILCKPFPPDETSEGGIFIPDSVKKTSNKVSIVKVGNGTSKKPMRLKPGDVGFRVKDYGTEVMIEGELHLLMEDFGILSLNE